MSPKTHFLIFVLLSFLLFSPNAYSQNPAAVEGVAISRQTEKPLENVSVQILELERYTYTDEKGYYKFKDVPPGTYTLTFNFIGYQAGREKFTLKPDEPKIIDLFLSVSYTALDEVLLQGRGTSLIGIAGAASQGEVGPIQIERRPISRTGEILETVPGLIVSQHSGSGKANQFYLRGLNLDHGTDFAGDLEGMPLNLPTNAHGQGYLDINFLIPELIKQIDFKKGPYYAEVGDFSSAGKTSIRLANSLDEGIVKAQGGLRGFGRGLVANSHSFEGDKHLLYGVEYQYSDGPWDNPENGNKVSGVLKFSGTTSNNWDFSLTGMGYHNKWNSTDQVPLRAVEQDFISRFGAIDDSDGGETGRYSLIGNWQKTRENSQTDINAYASYYRLNLFSNFTYNLEHPEKGDQFEQVERRLYAGGNVAHKWNSELFGKESFNKVGVQIRHDEIFEIGLHNTDNRKRFNTVRDDEVSQSSAGIFFNNKTRWLDKLKTSIGVRGDIYHFDVASNIQVNSGQETAFMASPKFQLVLGPWAHNEFYVDFGLGFHSNDARGTTIAIDPATGESVTKVDPLVRTKGAEVGVRSTTVKGLHSTLSLWYLGLDSELVFVGDAGGTEASDASEHLGIEWTNHYKPLSWLTLDLDVSFNRSRFVDVPGDADRIANSIDKVIKAGVAVDVTKNFYGGLRWRYFDGQPLTESGDIKSDPTRILNFRTGYKINNVELALDVLNIFDSEDPDISYYYISRLRGEPAEGVADIHYHPVLPLTARVSLTYRF